MIVLAGCKDKDYLAEILSAVSKTLKLSGVKEELVDIEEFRTIESSPDSSLFGENIILNKAHYDSIPDMENMVNFSRAMEYIHGEMRKGNNKIFIVNYSLVDFARGVSEEIDRLDREKYYERTKLEKDVPGLRDINASLVTFDQCSQVLYNYSSSQKPDPIVDLMVGDWDPVISEVYFETGNMDKREKNLLSYFKLPWMIRFIIDAFKTKGSVMGSRLFKSISPLKYHAIKMYNVKKEREALVSKVTSNILNIVSSKSRYPGLYSKEVSPVQYDLDR